MKKYFFLIVFFLLICKNQLISQGYPFMWGNVPTNTIASAQSWAITQDAKGFIYIANTSGILVYNGFEWKLIEMPNQQTVRFLGRAYNDTIYVGGQGEFGFLSHDANGSIGYQSLNHLIPSELNNFEDVWEFFVGKDLMVFRTTKAIYFKDSEMDSFDIVKTNTRFDRSFFINQKFYVRESESGLKVLENGKLNLIPGGSFYSNKMVMSIIPEIDKWVIATGVDGVYDYQVGKGFSNQLIKNDSLLMHLQANILYRYLELQNGKVLIGTTKYGLVLSESDFSSFQIINQSKGLSDNMVIDLFEDAQGNVWSVNGRNFSVLYPSQAWTELNENDGLEGAAYTSVLHKNRLLIGGSSGLFEYQNGALSRLMQISRQVWTFAEIQSELLIAYRNGLLSLNKELSFTNLKDNMWGVIYFDELSQKLYVGTYASGIMVLKKEFNDWQIKKSIPGYEESVRFFQTDKNKNIWISQPGKGVDKLTLDWQADSILEKKTYDAANGFPQNENNYVFNLKNHPFSELVFGTMKGVYYYDAAKDSMLKHPEFEPFLDTLETDLFVEDPYGNIWFQSLKDEKYYKGFLRKIEQNNWEIVDSPFFNLKSVYNESYAFLGDKVALNTSEGVFFYDIKAGKQKSVAFNSVIAKVQFNDSILYEAPGNLPDNFMLESNPKSIKFSFGALYFQAPEMVFHRYKLVGFDEDWSEWSAQNQKEYTNLPPGKFSFVVESKNLYEQKSQQAIIRFTVAKAWYQTYWAYLGYLLLLIFVIVLIVRLYTYKLKLDKIRLEKIILERTHEINQQKEELRTVAENLQEANTLILDKNGELEVANIKIASRNRQITDSITYALTIQSAMLPKDKHFGRFFSQSFILFKPKDIVSGDFYWIKESEDKIYVVAADCTGHGVPGGFMSMLGMAFLNEIWQNDHQYSPADILDELRLRVKQVFENANQTYEQTNGMDLSLILYDKTSGEMIFSGANSSILLMRHNSSEFDIIKGDRQPIGNYRKEVPFTQRSIQVNQGDWIYLFSDGFQDQIGEKSKMRYKSNQFYQFLVQINQLEADNKKQALDREFEQWKGSTNQVDDVLVIGLQI